MKYLVLLFAAACLARATRATASAPLPSFQSQSTDSAICPSTFFAVAAGKFAVESLRDLATALLFSSAILELHEQRHKRGFAGFLAA
jgi:hypothetical protein